MAAAAPTAITVADAEHPAAILLDLKLPEVEDGLGALREFRAQDDAVPVAIVTGHYSLEPDNEATIRALNASIAYKPLWLDDLLAVVRDLLGSRE